MLKPLTSITQWKSLAIGLLATGCLITDPAFAGVSSSNLSVTKTCALASDGDKNGNGKIDPSDILECTVTITNTGDGNDWVTTITDTSGDLEFQNDNKYNNGASIGVTIITPPAAP